MLQQFLDAKPLYYDEIDYTRMPRVYTKIKEQLKIPKIIHLIGTNGKGTTGRFLASSLHSLAYKVGHYTSPHILEFNERIWINGKNISNEELESAHKILLDLLSNDDAHSLSYFEYTSLLAMVLFQELEYVVLEAGLGGEYDATAVFKKELTLITPIDFDHQSFLGNSIKEIAITKLNAIQNKAILGKQVHSEIYELAKKLAQKKELEIFKVEEILSAQDELNATQISQELSLVPYLRENLKLSIAALTLLGIKYEISNFKESKLFGRLSPLTKNILIDVGHNTLAASSIVEALQNEKYILVYNSYKDKDYEKILSILKPIVEHVEILDIENKRAEDKEFLKRSLERLEISYQDFNTVDKEKKYLVFGSFSVVEEFLKVYND